MHIHFSFPTHILFSMMLLFLFVSWQILRVFVALSLLHSHYDGVFWDLRFKMNLLLQHDLLVLPTKLFLCFCIALIGCCVICGLHTYLCKQKILLDTSMWQHGKPLQFEAAQTQAVIFNKFYYQWSPYLNIYYWCLCSKWLVDLWIGHGYGTIAGLPDVLAHWLLMIFAII